MTENGWHDACYGIATSLQSTLAADHPVTKAFLARGWEWGGNWKLLKDYQHFEKPAKPAK